MPYIGLKRRKFGNGFIEIGKQVPYIPGRDYAKLERQGIVRWQSDPTATTDGVQPSGSTPKQAEEPASVDTPVVAIPADWRDLPWAQMRSLASKVSDEKAGNKEQVIAAIEAEEKRRAEAADKDGAPAPDDQPVEIPADWQSLAEDDKIALAADLTGEKAEKVEDAVAAIELALEQRTETDGKPA